MEYRAMVGSIIVMVIIVGVDGGHGAVGRAVGSRSSSRRCAGAEACEQWSVSYHGRFDHRDG